MADISDMVEFELSDEPRATFPVGAGGPVGKVMRFFYPIPVHLLHMFTGPVSLFSFFHILRQARGKDNMFKKQWDSLRSKKECDRCGGFEHEICPICESRGSLPYESKFAQLQWTQFHNPELLEKADEEGKQVAESIGGNIGKVIGRARGLRSHKDELDAELEYSMGKFKILGQKPGTLPCQSCRGEGVIKCQGCNGDAKKIVNWPDIDYHMQGPGRAMEQWMMTNPNGQPVTEIEKEFLLNDPHTAKWWTLQKYLVEGYKEHMTPRLKQQVEDEYDQFWWSENTRRGILEKRPGWQERLEVMKKEDPAWVSNALAVNPHSALVPEDGEGQRNNFLSLLENLQESPEVRTLRYMMLGPYNKLLEMYGVDSATLAAVRPWAKGSADKITQEWEELYGEEAKRWLEMKEETKNFGLAKEETPLLNALLYDIPGQMVKIKNEQRGDDLAACLEDPAIVEEFAEYVAMQELGNTTAAADILRNIEKSVTNLDLAKTAERDERRRKQREAGLARIKEFKQGDVQAGMAAIEAAGEVVSEIVAQDPEILELERSVKSIEEVRDAARERLEALPEPESFFSTENEEWLRVWTEARHFEYLHTIESAGLVRKMDEIRKRTDVFPVAEKKAQVRLATFEEDRLRHAEERRLERTLSREEFKSMLVEQWRKRTLNKDALEKVYDDLGPNADEKIFRMVVKERLDEQLEQAHRDAGKLGAREDHYVAIKSIESYEEAAKNGWDSIKQLTYPTVQYALMDEKAMIDQRKKIRRETIDARRAKIAKRGQIGTRLAETFQPLTNQVVKVRDQIQAILPKRDKKKSGKEQAAADVRKMDERQEAKRQREMERARIKEERQRQRVEKIARKEERTNAINRAVDERFDGVMAFLEDNVFTKMEDFFSGKRPKLPPSPELIAAESEALADVTAQAAKASAKQAEKLPGVQAKALQRISKAEERKRRAEKEFEDWKADFLSKPENRNHPMADSIIEQQRSILNYEENWLARIKRRAENAVQQVKDQEQLELDQSLALEAQLVREQLEREDLTIPEHVDVRRFLVQGTVRPDVLEAIFDKKPIMSSKTAGEELLESRNKSYEEDVRRKVQAEIEETERAHETEVQTVGAPVRQEKEQMLRELENARRAFLAESGRPSLEDSSQEENQLWKRQWENVGRDDWVTKTRTSLQLAFNPPQKRPVAFATLNPTLLGFGGFGGNGGPSWPWKK